MRGRFCVDVVGNGKDDWHRIYGSFWSISATRTIEWMLRRLKESPDTRLVLYDFERVRVPICICGPRQPGGKPEVYVPYDTYTYAPFFQDLENFYRGLKND